jgi:hypothetical protein
VPSTPDGRVCVLSNHSALRRCKRTCHATLVMGAVLRTAAQALARTVAAMCAGFQHELAEFESATVAAANVHVP